MKRNPQAAARTAQGRPRQISDVLSELNHTRREIMRPVLERAREYVLLSVRGLARKLEIDPSTAARMVRDCGFESYREFQEYLHELSMMQVTSFELIRKFADADSAGASFITDSFKQGMANLHAMHELLDAKKVTAFARKVWEAQRILVIGGDQAAFLVRYLGYNMGFLGLPISQAITPGECIHLARGMGKGDLVIALTFRRGLRQTVDAIKVARRKGAYCVGISDSYLSPLSRHVDELFLASVQATGFGASYVAPIALIDIVATACAKYGGARTIALLKEAAEEQRSGFRWYQESGSRGEAASAGEKNGGQNRAARN
jgi:DNA-binding MurR/RpiR family transcriptional regulator